MHNYVYRRKAAFFVPVAVGGRNVRFFPKKTRVWPGRNAKRGNDVSCLPSYMIGMYDESVIVF